MNTRIITLTFTEPCVLKLEVPATTAFAVAGEEKPGQTPGVEPVQAVGKVYDTARMMALQRLDEKKDFDAMRIIRDEFLTLVAQPQLGVSRQVLDERMKAKGVNGDEFIGLFVTNGHTVQVAQAIGTGINSALGARGQA